MLCVYVYGVMSQRILRVYSEYTQSILRVHAEYIYHFFIIHHDGKYTLRLSEKSSNVLTCGAKYVYVCVVRFLSISSYTAQNRKAPLCNALNHRKQCIIEGGHILIAYMLISQRISEYTLNYNSVRDQNVLSGALNILVV